VLIGTIYFEQEEDLATSEGLDQNYKNPALAKGLSQT